MRTSNAPTYWEETLFRLHAEALCAKSNDSLAKEIDVLPFTQKPISAMQFTSRFLQQPRKALSQVASVAA